MSAGELDVVRQTRALSAAAYGRSASLTIAIVLLALACLWPTTASLMDRWEDTVHRTYTHGYLIVALTLWLIWRDRGALPPPTPYVPAALLLIGGVVLWMIAVRAGLQIVHQALTPMLMFAAVLTCSGWRVLRSTILPLGILYCAIPLWDAINPLLQSTSVFAVRLLLRVVGIPAFFEGNSFQLPSGAFEIADGCSGLHFFVVAFSIAALYGAVNRDRLQTRVWLVSVALVLAMATNWLRIFVIVLAGHMTEMQHYLVREEHYSFGWVVFAGAMLVFFLIVRRLPLASQDTSATLEPPSRSGVRGLALAAGGLAVAPVWLALDRNIAEPYEAHSLAPAINSAMCEHAEGPRPVFKAADKEQFLRYTVDDAPVYAYAAIYRQQHQGKELAGYENSVLGSELRSASAPTLVDRHWRELRARDRAGKDWLLRYSHRIEANWYASPIAAQLAYGVYSLVRAPTSSIIVIRAECGVDCSAARATLVEFSRVAFR